MVGALMAAGVAALVGGLLALVASIPIRDFSFGSTLMIVGAIGVASGLVVVALSQILREVRRLSTPPLVVPATTARPEFPPRPSPSPSPVATPVADMPFPIPPRAAPVVERPQPPERAPRPETEAPPLAGSDVRAPGRRNLMYRRSAEASEPPPDGPPPPERETADASWPQPTPRPPEGLWKRRRRETLPPPAEPMLDLKKDEAADAPRVTVLKSGVVDGMAYTLYSDGSIEAQLGEGMVRFESIEALRTHLDQRSS